MRKVIFFIPAAPEHVKKLSAHQFELMFVCVCVCVCVCVYVCVFVFVFFHCKGFSWLNKAINVMREIRPVMLRWGNISVSRTFAAIIEYHSRESQASNCAKKVLIKSGRAMRSKGKILKLSKTNTKSTKQSYLPP